jgi:hypothetical protein
MVSFTPRPLYPQEKSLWYPLDRGLSGPRSRSGHCGEEKNSHPLSGLEPPISQPVAQRYTTELPGSYSLHEVLKINAQRKGVFARKFHLRNYKTNFR